MFLIRFINDFFVNKHTIQLILKLFASLKANDRTFLKPGTSTVLIIKYIKQWRLCGTEDFSLNTL